MATSPEASADVIDEGADGDGHADPAAYPDYDYPVPRTVEDLIAIRDGTGTWRRRNRDAMNGMQTRAGTWTDPHGRWSHQVRGKVVDILARYLPPAPHDTVGDELITRVHSHRGQSMQLSGTAGDVDQLTTLGHLALRARDAAWAAGARDGAYYLAIYGGRALIHAAESARESGH